MKQWLIFIFVVTAFSGFAGHITMAADGDEVEGSVSIGAWFSDTSDDPGRVVEFETVEDDGSIYFKSDMTAGNENRSIRIEGELKSEDDMYSNIEFQAGQVFRDYFSYKRYVHRLDHDYLANLEGRESVDPSANKPGGKMVTHDDMDIDGTYGIVISELSNRMEIDLGKHAMLSWHFRNLARKGYKQTRSINHCSMCHVTARRTRVDEETRDNSVGLALNFSKVDITYQFTRSDFSNFAKAPKNYYEPAVHPVSGEMNEEFASRTNFQDAELAYSLVPNTHKEKHELKFSSEFSRSQSMVGILSMLKYSNEMEGLDMDDNYGAFRWSFHPGKKFRIQMSVSRESIDNDDVFIDLAPWREGRAGGGQDFDWTRYSAFNRDVTIARIRTSYAVSKTNLLSFDYRFRSIDRDYLEIEQGSNETESVQNRFKMAWISKSSKFRGHFSVEYEMTDTPFANKYAMCEPAYKNAAFLPDNGKFYYFQRERLGDASNQPSDSLRFNANVTLLSGKSFSLNLQGSYQDQKNDNLNTYEWNQSTALAGINLFLAPSGKIALSTGYNYLNVETDALFCIPVMDG